MFGSMLPIGLGLVLSLLSPAVLAIGVDDLAQKLEQSWESSKDNAIFGPCESWVADRSEALKKQNQKFAAHELISTAKSELCNQNALAGFGSGILAIPVADMVVGAAAGFWLQAKGA